MGLWLFVFDSEASIEHEDSLPGPSHEEPMIRPLKSLHITPQLLVHVEEARGRGHAHTHTEGQAVSLSWAVVRVLA